MCNWGFVHYKTQKTNSKRIGPQNYLSKLFLILKKKQIKGAAIIMDNASFHRCTEIREYTTYMVHELIFLPPYTPFFIPIENVYAQWKSLVIRGFPYSHLQLKIVVNNIKKNLSIENINNYFNHAHNNVHDYLSGISVT